MNETTETRFERRHGLRGRGIFWPLLLIGAGVIFLLQNAGVISGNGWELFLRFWPLLIIVGALDGLWRGDGIAGQIFWLGVGVIFLLSNLGYLGISVWELVFRFWPVLLIAIGIDVLIGRRASAWAQMLAVVLALGLLGGLVWYAVSQPALGSRLETETISQPLQGAQSADLNLSLNAGQLLVSGGAPDGQLVAGDINVRNAAGVRKNSSLENGKLSYRLNEDGTAAWNVNNNSKTGYDLKISSTVPLEFQSNLGAGEEQIDLTGVKVESLNVNLGVGQVVVTLPAEGSFRGSISGAVGELVVRVPKGLSATIDTHRAITGLSVSGLRRDGSRVISGTGSDVVLDVNMPVGSIRIEEIP